ncbi:hypothetical protein LSUE1_G001915 [Lachnellula suecica]|uniref:Uncharacterized protein n=1 Tax=Lachnellula suecica TaxID=602035 RepID=A0A8T9C943_9HELO|nr:hypothetical protein LSUE1_G001915 [Lachnellula suecica]
MTRNKPRLQVALYARPKHPGTYHYAIFISPKLNYESRKNKKGVLSSPWRFERVVIADMSVDPRLLVVVTIGKLAPRSSVESIERYLVEKIPIFQEGEIHEGSDFDCVSWTKKAVQILGRDGLVQGVGRWDKIRAVAVKFVETKRMEGRWEVGWKGEKRVPTLDVSDGREFVT